MIHASPEPADAAHACQPRASRRCASARPLCLLVLRQQTLRMPASPSQPAPSVSARPLCLLVLLQQPLRMPAPSTKYPGFGTNTPGKNGGVCIKTGVVKGRFPLGSRPFCSLVVFLAANPGRVVEPARARPVPAVSAGTALKLLLVEALSKIGGAHEPLVILIVVVGEP